jgi:pantoate--beta-alanine ligase
MFAVNLNKTMPIFYGKVALIESLKSIKTQILLLVSLPTMGALHQSFINAAIIG